MERVRIDRWLWAVRLFKTRSSASSACRLGQVTIARAVVKASRLVGPGDEIEIVQGPLTRTVRVAAVLERRVGAKLVAGFMEDLTSEEAWEAARAVWSEERLIRVVGSSGLGRPSKRDRRIMDSFLDDVRRQSDADC